MFSRLRSFLIPSTAAETFDPFERAEDIPFRTREAVVLQTYKDSNSLHVEMVSTRSHDRPEHGQIAVVIDPVEDRKKLAGSNRKRKAGKGMESGSPKRARSVDGEYALDVNGTSTTDGATNALKTESASPSKVTKKPVSLRDRSDSVPDTDSEAEELHSSPKKSYGLNSASRVQNGRPAVVNGLQTSSLPPSAQQNKRIRFGSEDPTSVAHEDSIPAPISAPIEQPAEDISDSDDDAPEAVSRSAAQETVQAQQAEAARAIEQQQAAVRRKRKERDSRLKEQAAQSRRHKRQKLDGAPTRNMDDLPDLLPDEILAEEPVPRLPTPPSLALQPRHHKKFDLAEKRIKDIKRGPLKIRVLDKANGLLAPKASKGSRNLKESEFKNRGVASLNGGERRTKSKGFLKR